MDIGQKIKTARTAKGLTQEELGKLVGVQKSAIAKYENGRVVNIKRSTLQKIAKELDLRPSELIFENSPKEAAEIHVEMIMDEDLTELFADFKKLGAAERKIIKDLAHTLSETKKAEA